MKTVLSVLVAFFVTTHLFAASKMVTIDAFDFNYAGGLMFKSDHGSEAPDRTETSFKVNLNYAQDWEKYVGVMWRAKAFIERDLIDADGAQNYKEMTWGAAGGFIYNYSHDDVKNSFYASGMLGLERSVLEIGDGDDEAGFNLFVDFEGGKRFDLGSYSIVKISYSPSVSVKLKRYGGDIRDRIYKSGNEFKFNFLKFDLFF